jgi:hypothetical protein
VGRLAVLALVLACACSGNLNARSDAGKDTATSDAGADPNDGFRSGSRLKLTWYEFTDGTRAWTGLYDAERKESCNIYPGWTDGNAYCVPSTATGYVVFTNATCTQRVIQQYVDPTCPAATPTYAVDYQYSACTSAASHLYQRGTATSVANYYVQDYTGTCSGPYASSPALHYYAFGPEVATSQLVQLGLSASGMTTRLSPRYYASSDGARVPWGAHDAMLGTDCYVSSYAPTSAICAPSTNAYAYEFHDAQCTQVVYGQPAGCPAPHDIGFFPSNACPNDPPTYYAAGGTVASSPLYETSGPSCVTAPAQSGTFYAAGAQLQLASLARAPDTLAGHRLQLVHDTSSDLTSRDYALWDSMEQTECYPATGTDGTIHCLPAQQFTTSLFTDSACRNPIELLDLSTGPTSCATPTPPRFATKFVQVGCTYQYEPHPVGAAFAGTAYANYGTCQAYVPSGKLYQVGAAVAATSWASATSVTDP